jgi:hypothetical protein
MPNRHRILHARSRKRGIVSKSHPDKGTYRNLAFVSVSPGYQARTCQNKNLTPLFFAFPDKFGVGGPLIERTRLWYRLDGKRIAV